jgi:hypothetical protein
MWLEALAALVALVAVVSALTPESELALASVSSVDSELATGIPLAPCSPTAPTHQRRFRHLLPVSEDSESVSEAQLIHQDLMVFQPFQTPFPLLAHNQPDNPVPGQREPH